MRINNLLPLLAFLIVTVITSSTVMAANKKASQSNEKEANAKLRITCFDSNEGAVVSINGKVKGECPFDTQVPAGTVTVSAKKTSADGAFEQVFEKELVMGEGIVKKVEIELGPPVITEAGKRIELEKIERAKADLERVHIAMAQVPRGSFMMGLDNSFFVRPAHRVVVDYDFEIGQYEVTQAQWQAVMGDNPSRFKSCGQNCPVESVSWGDVQTFIKKLNQLTDKKYRLPTEAEWEYACRTGTGWQYKYCGGENFEQVAWFPQNSNNTTHPVGQKAPNAWGLYDMSGNVFEMVQDNHHDSYEDAPSNAKQAWGGGDEYSLKVIRGWCFISEHGAGVRSSGFEPRKRIYDVGFRLARTLP